VTTFFFIESRMFAEPLLFEPVLFERVWGGNRLGRLFGKPLPAGKVIGESWELCDRPEAQTRVAYGPHAGKTFRELLEAFPREILGEALAAKKPSRFPLLLKYVDAGSDLSVQVHPDDAGAVKYKDRGKAECWIVVHVDAGAKIVRGLKPGTTRADYERAVAEEHVEKVLHVFEPKVGDCVALPPGLVHAIGAGVVVAELQQNSDVTLRIYDYKRLGLDGKPRQLHVKEALESIRFGGDPGHEFAGDMHIDAVTPLEKSSSGALQTELLLKGTFFDLQRLTLAPNSSAGWTRTQKTATVAMILAGQGRINTTPVKAGQTLLLPAELPPCKLEADGETLIVAAGHPHPESA
jgi:mannose-6-phosphate isomerase